MSQPAGIGIVIRLLQPAVWLHRRWVGQRPPVGGLQQPIDEPVPVVGGLDHPALEVCLLWGSALQKRGEMLGYAWVIDHLVLLIESDNDRVGCMPINPAV